MKKPVNLTEILVEQMLDEQLARKKNICKCDRCKADITAFALNHLPPRYVVTDKGQAILKADTLNTQLRTDLIVEINKAIEQIAKNPRHEEQEQQK